LLPLCGLADERLADGFRGGAGVHARN